MKKSFFPILIFLYAVLSLLISCSSVKPVIVGQEANSRFDSVAHSDSEKYALVLGGGGARGSYEAGVFRALKELQYPIDIVTGTSVGALNSIFVVMDDLAGVEHLWRTVDETMIFSNPAASAIKNGRSSSGDLEVLFKNFAAGNMDSYEPLRNLMRQSYDPVEFYNSPIDFGTVVFDVKRLGPRLILKNDIKPELLPDFMLASAACYPAFTPYVIDGVVFIDGGYVDNIPVDVAKELGATRYVIVSLDSLGTVNKAAADVLKMDDTVFISPYWDLGSMLYFNPENAERNMRLGYLDAMKQFGAYAGRAYAFFPNTFADLSPYNAMLEDAAEFEPCAAVLSKHWRGSFSFGKTVLTCAEFAAEIFDMDPLILYRRDIFQSRLRQKIASAKITAPPAKNDSAARVFDILPLLREETFVKNVFSKRMTNELKAVAKKYPKEFLAAVYVHINGVDL